MIIIYSIISALVIMLASLSGAVFIRKEFGSWMHKYLKFLVTFSAGVFIAIVYHLIGEVFHESEASWVSIAGWIALGAILTEILSHLIPHAHHHHGEKEHDHAHSALDARRMLLGDAMHNISDGILLVPAFIVDVRIGLITAIAILIHELVQEVSEFFVLKEAGYTNKQALVLNFLVSTTILLGIAISFAVSSIESLEAPLIAFSAGGFIYIVVRDLIPHGMRSVRKHGNALKHAVALAAGIVIMFALAALLPHEPAESDRISRATGTSTLLASDFGVQ